MQLKAIMTLTALAVGTMAMAEAYTIPPEKVDGQKIYWGTAANFEKPGEVSYEAVVKATPEYAEIKKKKVERGTAKYWILMSQASEHAVQLIAEVGEESNYDLISAQGYLAELDPPVPAEDITKLVLAKLDDDGKGRR
jgi:hypothetical protein